MQIKYFEKGFNYSQDGQGNRLVYHLQGCNMKCPWCSNPEGMKCDANAHCSSINELAEEIKGCMPMFFDGGGVTFTGGECSLQYKALLELIEILKESGISVAIETNASTDGFLPLANRCDIVILDYKHPDAEKLKIITGGALSLIEENIKRILKEKYLHIRIPLIHGFNDSDMDFESFKRFFSSLSGEFDVEILEYHEYGKGKWEQIGLEYMVTNGYVSPERVQKLKEILEEINVKIIKT